MKKKFLGMMLVFLLVLAGCSNEVVEHFTVHSNLEKESITIEKDQSTALDISLQISLGELQVSKGATEWIDGSIEYNVKKLEPEVTYELTQNRGQVEIKQNEGDFGFRNIGGVENSWDFKLTNEIPLDLKVMAGVSETKLDLKGLQIQNLEVETGVGEVTIDMSGEWEEGFNANFKTGLGSSTIILPSDIGVIIKTEKGIVATDFIKLKSLGNGVYVNDAYDASESDHIKINAELGMGEVMFKVK
ncbi:toast rack family protein [Chengkuizengella axinellae]|uniref:Toast rack family protein n=1 Tax=Chengkuizengella axinellae TaxID=3064388 RepID=A0ABT9J531_9BACL|nr:toast rack family protein [Chengkuizengella sp. 2205SS18-9]MDP5276731.1 toast rack family protein [Chengkuizengella sp. 2205SS18-9]